jgi:nicotinate-nucleotide--dimethylbenzimidazole phosphoribosyltransferase
MDLEVRLQKRINEKTKPLHALGMLEFLALKCGMILGVENPSLKNPHIVVFAADHGIALEGVSAYPSEVTTQMVLNFLNGGAAINVFCKQHDIFLTIVDAGVAGKLPEHPLLRVARCGAGTQNMLFGPAMTQAQMEFHLNAGAAVVREIALNGSNIIGFGEMGIGNTSSVSLIISSMLG